MEPTLDAAFKALADSSRRRLLDALRDDDGQTLTQMCAHLEMSRQAASQHLAILESANLIAIVWQGREKLHYLNPVPLFEVSERWVRRFERSRLGALRTLKTQLEEQPMTKPDFAYAIYINASREAVWNGLLEPEFTRQYWFHENISDWQEGSRWEHRSIGEEPNVDIEGVVLESEEHKKLVISWSRKGESEDPSRTSRLSFTLGDVDWPGGPWTSLHLEHTDFGDDHEMCDSVSGGWPMIMSGLKTLLEKGFEF